MLMSNAASQKRSTKGPQFSKDDCDLPVYLFLLLENMLREMWSAYYFFMSMANFSLFVAPEAEQSMGEDIGNRWTFQYLCLRGCPMP